VAIELFFILLAVGLLLLGAEIFVPGGILGIIGAVALLGAVILGFTAFPGYGSIIALCIFILTGIAVILWIKIFPQTRIGKNMTMSRDLSTSKASEAGIENLLNKTGITASKLRPGGFAEIDGHRKDVITRGEMIDAGKKIKVIEIESNRIVVTEVN
jgi:membrane-bound serine protease (ClpP class)